MSAPAAARDLPLREVACPLCGGRERRRRLVEPPFTVWTCVGCDLVYVSPRVADEALVEGVYDEHYWRSPRPRDRGYRDYAADAPLYLATYRRRLRGLDRHLPAGGRVLDVGCAAGYFLQVMAERGWEVCGLEPSAPIRALAEDRLGPGRVHAADVSSFVDAGGRGFDLVTLWDVFEHLPDPLEALARARSLLAPGGRGRLLVETQNVASPWARLLGRRWQHYKHAEHLTHFRPATLRRALDRAGFAVSHLSARHAGKVVRLDFVVERARRVAPPLAFLLAPLLRLGNPSLYLNPMDELIAVARAVD